MYQTGKMWESIRTKLQSDLDDIVQWTASNSLSLNANKTQAMIFGPCGKLSKLGNLIHIKVANVSVKFVKQ